MNALLDLFSRLGGRMVSLDRATCYVPTPTCEITQHSTTVFSGTPQEWLQYLDLGWDLRRDPDFAIEVLYGDRAEEISFSPRTRSAEPLAEWLRLGLGLLYRQLDKTPVARRVLDELIAGSKPNRTTPIHIHTYEHLPSEATREVQMSDDLEPVETDIVLRTSMVEEVTAALQGTTAADWGLKQFGIFWPVLRRVLSQLGYSNYPRDRFTERIDLTAKLNLITINALYSGTRSGVLEPNTAGECYHAYVAQRDNIPEKHLIERHSYFRMLNEQSFLRDDSKYDALGDAIKIAVRDYLDGRYLRLSVAGLMPSIPDWAQPMPYEWKKKNVVTPPPRLGQFGIFDDEDLHAWRRLEGPLRDVGYVIIRQLGMGQFGRVYEAINLHSGAIPEKVAIKVDRICKASKDEAIQSAETILAISRGLSSSPHVIRVFDAGSLARGKYTYHVLQFVDGDTLDNLIGVTGMEHASILRPGAAHHSIDVIQKTLHKSLRGSAGERWRKARITLPFTDDLSLIQLLDLLTSKLLWVEEVHRLGYAINDLKNGNVMVSRTGQFKGIDLDAYSPIFSPLDKRTDFFFLGVSFLLIVLGKHAGAAGAGDELRGVISNPAEVRRLIREDWQYGDIETASNNRVSRDDFAALAAEIIEGCRSGSYAHEPIAFSHAIDHLIMLKRGLSSNELVFD